MEPEAGHITNIYPNEVINNGYDNNNKNIKKYANVSDQKDIIASNTCNENISNVFIKVETCLDNDQENNDEGYIKIRMNVENSLVKNETSNSQTEDITYINIKSEFNDMYDGVNVDDNTTDDSNKPIYNHVIIKEERNVNEFGDAIDTSIMPEKTIKMDIDFPSAKFQDYDNTNIVYENHNIEDQHRVESTKASTTEVQKKTSRKKTNAQKCREYRERKKLQNTMVQNITAEKSDECSDADQLQAKKPKTNAERRKKHYEAQKLKKQESKKIPKTVKQKNKEYYERKKKIQALNTLNHHSVAFIKTEQPEVDLSQEPEKKVHKCSICSFQCKTFIALKVHEKTHNQKNFKCSQCFKKFKSNNELVEHKLTHTETSYKCPSCDAVFTNHCDYLIHQIEIHVDSIEYTCPECDITYNRKYLKGHIRNHFYNKSKCTICNEMVNKRYLKSHMNWHNSAYKCAECGHISKEKRMYEYHMAIHTGVNIYQCYYCGAGFKHASGRYRHMDVYHKPVEKLFECTICNKKFRERVVLTRHMAIHDNNRRLDCKYCDKKYKNENCLKLHLLKHENKQKYECTVCGVKRSTSQSLRTHMLYKHSKERPYRCEVCNLTYKCPQDIEKHNASQMHKDRMLKLKNMNVKIKTEE